MHDSISTDGPQRPRGRRGLGVLVGVTLMAAPLALAPAASAQAGGPGGAAGAIFTNVLAGVLGGNTLGNPLGGGSSEQPDCYANEPGIGPAANCAVVPLHNAIDGTPGAKAKAKIKARRSLVSAH